MMGNEYYLAEDRFTLMIPSREFVFHRVVTTRNAGKLSDIRSMMFFSY